MSESRAWRQLCCSIFSPFTPRVTLIGCTNSPPKTSSPLSRRKSNRGKPPSCGGSPRQAEDDDKSKRPRGMKSQRPLRIIRTWRLATSICLRNESSENMQVSLVEEAGQQSASTTKTLARGASLPANGRGKMAWKAPCAPSSEMLRLSDSLWRRRAKLVRKTRFNPHIPHLHQNQVLAP